MICHIVGLSYGVLSSYVLSLFADASNYYEVVKCEMKCTITQNETAELSCLRSVQMWLHIKHHRHSSWLRCSALISVAC